MRQLLRHVSLVSALLIVACSSRDSEPDAPAPSVGGAGGEEVSCTDDTRVSAFERGLAVTGDSGFRVALDEADPEPPARGDNGWTVTLLDAQGAPLPAAELAITAYMPDHGHMSPTTPSASPTDDAGHATISGLNLFMAGVWFVDVTITEAGADEPADHVRFAFCVEG